MRTLLNVTKELANHPLKETAEKGSRVDLTSFTGRGRKYHQIKHTCIEGEVLNFR